MFQADRARWPYGGSHWVNCFKDWHGNDHFNEDDNSDDWNDYDDHSDDYGKEQSYGDLDHIS